MSEETKLPPPPLQFPDEGESNVELNRILEKLKKNSYDNPEKDKILKVKCIYGMNWLSGFLVNLAWIALIFTLIYTLLSHIKRFPIPDGIKIGLPLVASIAFAVMLMHRMWTNSKAREARMFLNTITGTILLCFKGFHFLPWHNTEEPDVIDFLTHRKIIAKRENKNPIRFKTNDNRSVELDLTILWKRGQTEQALGRSLNYTMENLDVSILSFVTSRVSAIGACNSFDTLRHYKDQFIAWVGASFAGKKRISVFEDETGTTIDDPIAEDFDLDSASRVLFDKQAALGVYQDAVRELAGDKKVSADEVSKSVQAIMGVATRTINTVDHTYTVNNLPPSVTVFAPGGEGVAVSTKGGK